MIKKLNDLNNRTFIISRTSGFQTARSLSFHGCTVIFACRNEERADTAIEIIKNERENVTCDTLQIDFSSLHSVREAAEKFKQKYRY